MAKVLARSEQPYEGFSSYYAYICNVYEKKRDYLVESLRAAKLQPIVPEGGFFIMADTSSHTDKVADKYRNEPGPRGEVPVTKDWAFARWLTAEIGVTPIPPSAFYTDETKHLAADFARFAFCKVRAHAYPSPLFRLPKKYVYNFSLTNPSCMYLHRRIRCWWRGASGWQSSRSLED